ncbi:MAG: DNA primase [Bacteroidales bacterium]|nr:DNA primase [Bacteroidales bacterium]
MIDEVTKQRIIDSADIYEVISDYVALKKRGVNYVGCCPFHNEKTGSFTVSPAKGIFKCFGCGKGGDVVHFVMEHDQLSYYDALRRLAERYHIKIEERELSARELQQRSERDGMLTLNSFAQKFFAEQLVHSDEGKSVGLSYLLNRGMDIDTIERFGIGYNPGGWDKLTQAAIAAGYKKEFLLKTGLSTETQKGTLVDRFHDRVMFPIKDSSGKVIAFGGRIMSADKKAAKYQNSPESEIYHKKMTLYGIDVARSEAVRADKCYLVEGYFDVISMYMRGIKNVVASSGTSLTVEQIQMLRRMTPNVTVMYDGDSAGIHAALRGIDLLLKEGLNVRVVLMPDGEDPDSFAQKHTTDEINEFISSVETDFISFKANLLLESAGKDPIERSKAIQDVIRTISLIPDNITRSVYVKSCSEIMKISEHEINIGISRLLRGVQQESAYVAKPKPITPEQPRLEEGDIHKVTTLDKLCKNDELELVRALLQYGTNKISIGGNDISVAQYIIGDLNSEGLSLYNETYRAIVQEYSDNINQTDFDPLKHFTQFEDGNIVSSVADIVSEKYELEKIWNETSEPRIESEHITKLLNNYKLRRIVIRIKQIDKKIAELTRESEPDHNEIFEWMKKKMALNELRSLLVNAMGRSAVQ